ncbi:thymidine phosphorylase, partial [Candidatus Endoriftia persephone str. Guaymas]|nr:thymidine phosphorylase [Candidatus Endoriftia persephone str. Guaymas]
LKDGWKDVMLLNYLRQGPDSDDWKESLEIVDKLLWSVRPKEEYAERQELLRNIPELLRNLRERLNSISFDQHKMARLFKELQNCHISCLRGKELPSPVNTAMAVAEKQVSFPDSRLLETSSLLADSEVIETPSVPHD